MRYLITLIFTILMWLAFATLINHAIAFASTTPDWVLGKGHTSFPNSKYLSGVGLSEKSPIMAAESARAELIKTVRVQVKSVMSDYNSRDKSVSESSILSEADFLLEGAQTKDGWYDSTNNLYYSFVVIERQLVLRSLKVIIDNMIQSIASMLRQGDSYKADGDIMNALVHYYDGYKESEKLLPCIQTYNSVIMVNEYKIDHAIIFKEKIQQIVGNIYLEKIDHSITVSNYNLNVRALYNGEGIRNFPIKFSSNYNRYNEKILCNRSGVCSVSPKITRIVHKDESDIVVKAQVDLPTFERHFNHQIKKRFFGRLELLNVSFKAKRKVVAKRPVQREHQQPVKFKSFNNRFYKNDIGLGPLRRPFFIDRWKANRRGYSGNINVRIGW
jgi:hypothetical protein